MKAIALIDIIHYAFEVSKSEARRAIKDGAVDVDGEKITESDLYILIEPEAFPMSIRLGKRRWRKITYGKET